MKWISVKEMKDMTESYDKTRQLFKEGKISASEAIERNLNAYKEANGGSLKGVLSSIHDYLGYGRK